MNRASDLAVRKDGMSDAIQSVTAANAGIEGITKLIEAAKGLTQTARSADTAGRSALAVQHNTILGQIDALASDSGHKGTNLLNGDSIVVDSDLDTALNTIRSQASTFASTTSIITILQDYTANMISTLQTGQSLGTTALS